MNYIKKVAELLNVEVGEHFTIHFKKEKRQIKNFYFNEETGKCSGTRKIFRW